MFAKLRHALLRPAMIGALVLTLVAFSAPAAMAIPIDDNPPIPTPTPTPPPTNAPDLTVESFSYGSFNTWFGKVYYVDARIRNQSNYAAGQFSVRNLAGSATTTRQINGLAAGSFVDVRFFRTTCESGGRIVADVFNQVVESSETNNQRNWLLIC